MLSFTTAAVMLNSLDEKGKYLALSRHVSKAPTLNWLFLNDVDVKYACYFSDIKSKNKK